MSVLLFGKKRFSPARLFAAGEQGAWYDPSDLSTLFKVSTDTEPNVAVGDPVGKILDKSGRGNHATQTTLTARPTLQQDETGRYFLLFDGTDDCLFTSAIDFTSTDKMTVWAGGRKLSDAAAAIIAELSATASGNNGSFWLAAPDSAASNNYSFTSRGTARTTIQYTTYTAPTTNVLSASLTTAIASPDPALAMTVRINGVNVTGTAASFAISSGNFGNYPLYIGRRNNATLSWNGRLYSFIVRGVQSTLQQITQTETWVNRKTGAY